MIDYFIAKYTADDEVIGVIAYNWPYSISIQNVKLEEITKAQYETYIEFGMEDLTLAQLSYRSDGYR